MQQYGMWYRHLPHVKPFYAVKCNPDPVLLKWLARRGVNFDCASARELYMVKEHIGGHGFGNRVLLANPCKTPNDIQVSKTLGVGRVTVDSVEELVKMHTEGYSPEIVIRLAVDDSGSACPFNAKFGLEPEKAKEICLAAKSLDMSVVGLSFHVGSGSHDTRAFRTAVRTCKDVWSDLLTGSKVGHKDFKVLDLGGGWSHEEAIFKDQAWHAKEGLKYGPLPLETIAEPGRFFAAPVQDLYVKVVGKKPRAGGGWRYTLDESIYGQFSCIPFDHAKPKLARLCLHKDEPDDRATTDATFFGRTCDSLDWICNTLQTESLDVGDWLYVPNMGAYTTATATEFNGFPKPTMIESDEVPEMEQVRWLERVEYPLASMLSVKKAVSTEKMR
jgi:ornithine decarboxylase